MIQIRNMIKGDIERVGEIIYEGFQALGLKYGYHSNIENVDEGKLLAWALFHHGPAERLVAEVDNRVVGTTCLSIRGNFGGLGPTVVDPNSEARGVGSKLIDSVIKRDERVKEVRTIIEAFNPAVFSLLYFKLNFVPVCDLLDVYLSKSGQLQLNSCENVSQISSDELDEICMYDRTRSKLDRRPDLKYYINWGKVLVYREKAKIKGFLACLPGPRWVQLGPLVAEGEAEAECLFQHALAVYNGKSFRSRVMIKDNGFVKALKDFGFKIYCINLVMVRGSWRPNKYVEAFGIFPEAV